MPHGNRDEKNQLLTSVQQRQYQSELGAEEREEAEKAAAAKSAADKAEQARQQALAEKASKEKEEAKHLKESKERVLTRAKQTEAKLDEMLDLYNNLSFFVRSLEKELDYANKPWGLQRLVPLSQCRLNIGLTLHSLNEFATEILKKMDSYKFHEKQGPDEAQEIKNLMAKASDPTLAKSVSNLANKLHTNSHRINQVNEKLEAAIKKLFAHAHASATEDQEYSARVLKLCEDFQKLLPQKQAAHKAERKM